MSAPVPTPTPAEAPAPVGHFDPGNISKVVSSRGWYITKLVLGSFIILFDLILIGVGAGIIGNANFYSMSLYDFLLAFCPAIVSLGWQIAEFVTVCVHRDRRGIHPGAHVGLHLVLWLGFVACLTLLSIITAYHSPYASDYIDYTYSYRYSYRGYRLFLKFEYTLLTFIAMQVILHFTLFVRFCIECSRRNTMTGAAYFVRVGGTGGVYFVQQPPMVYMPGSQQQPQTKAAQGQHSPAAAGPHTSMYGGYYP